MKVLFLFILLTILLIVGVIILFKIDKSEPDGLLNVDTRDPDKDYYDFVYLIPTDEIPKKKFLKIEVKTKS